MKLQVAYVDDDELNLECMEVMLNEDFSVSSFQSQAAFLKSLENNSYDCILLDLHMPEGSGFELYDKILSSPSFNGCPIFFVSTDDSIDSRIQSLTLGAVDYISRSVSPMELVARIKGKLKFFQSHRNIIEFDSLTINLSLLKAYIQGQEISITFTELKLLTMVLRSYPDSIPKEQVLEHVWRKNSVLDATLYTHIFNLNTKIFDWGYEIFISRKEGTVQLRKVEK